jgi:hypothetical protein
MQIVIRDQKTQYKCETRRKLEEAQTREYNIQAKPKKKQKKYRKNQRPKKAKKEFKENNKTKTKKAIFG